MKVIIACEESQEVCKAFRKLGYEAYSCDLVDCSGGHPEWHIKDNILKHLDDGWDLMIAFPPCTRLCNSGVMWLDKRNLWIEMQKGAEFFRTLLNADIERIAVENPIPHKYALEIIGRKYSQIIQPYMFGHGETKATCLWLKNLPLLKPSDIVPGREQRLHRLPPSSDRAKIRSKTFLGIAEALATQFTAFVNSGLTIREWD
jgi:hypothetical protein